MAELPYLLIVYVDMSLLYVPINIAKRNIFYTLIP